MQSSSWEIVVVVVEGGLQTCSTQKLCKKSYGIACTQDKPSLWLHWLKPAGELSAILNTH